MPRLPHGIERGLAMIVEAGFVAVLIGAMVPPMIEQGLIPAWLFQTLTIMSIFVVIMTIDDSRYWSFGYLAGYAIGVFMGLPIFIEAGVFGPLQILLNSLTAIGSIGLRLHIHT